MLHTTTSLLALRRQFMATPDRAARQVGLRRIADAGRIVGRVDLIDQLNHLVAEAKFQLPYAKAAR